jgi:cysteine-rich PDZ-binding protein
MVCQRCEKKLDKLVVPDKWKAGARNTTTQGTLNENKLLSKGLQQARFNPYEQKCKLCFAKIHQSGAYYCQGCAYKNGICAMCGNAILDTKNYRQSMV